MYRGALVSGIVNILVYFNKLANNFDLLDRFFFKNWKFSRLTVFLYDLLVSRLLVYCRAVK